MFTINREKIQAFTNSDRAMLSVCIFIALFFWLLIKLSKTFTSSYTCAVYYNLPEGKAFQVHPPQTISIYVKGAGWDLISNYFRTKESSIVIDLNKEASQTIYNSQLKNKFAATIDTKKVTIERISHEFITVVLDDEMLKKVPIVLKGTIAYAATYAPLDSIHLIPDSVAVTGPLHLLETIDSWATEEVFIKDINEDYSQQIALSQKEGANIALNPKEVQLHIPVEQYTEKSLSVPIRVTNAVDSLIVFPDKVELSFMVGLTKFNAVNPDDFLVEVNAAQISQTSTTFALQLKAYPTFLRNIKMIPKSVEFMILKE